jgi:hypothetical protein
MRLAVVIGLGGGFLMMYQRSCRKFTVKHLPQIFPSVPGDATMAHV